jgi:putative phosphoesterase
MRIGIVSDTHMSRSGRGLPRALIEGLQGIDGILHAGDWTSLEVLDLLERIAPVDGVTGNNDGDEIEQRFGRKKIVTRSGYRIGMIHGDGLGKTTEQRAMEAFRDEKVDVVLFGHSHTPYHAIQNGILLFNPGSPTDKRRQPLYSYGILELTDRLEAKHYYYEDKSE